MKNSIARRLALVALTLILGAGGGDALASDGMLQYKGQLNLNGNPANGLFDLRFSLFNAASSGAQVGPLLTPPPVSVNNGSFTVTLDFGSGVFTGAPLWMEVYVRESGSSGEFNTLAPRQRVAPLPSAIHADKASTSLLASNVTNGTIDGTPIGQIAPAVGTFTTLGANGPFAANNNVTLGTALNHIVTINAGSVVASSATVAAAGFSGSGSGLTSLSAGNLVGTVPSANLPGNQTITGGTINGATIGQVTPDLGTFTTLTANNTLNAQGDVTLGSAQSHAVTINAGSVVAQNTAVTAASFSGSGSGLTSLSAANLVGTVPSANLPGNQTITGGTINGATIGQVTPDLGTFTTLTANNTLNAQGNVTLGSALSHTVTINAGNVVAQDAAVTAASFSGSGAGLTSLSAANLAGTLPDSALDGNYTHAVHFNNSANTFTGTLAGNADTATAAATATTAISATTAATATTASSAATVTGSFGGDVNGTQSATVVANVGGQTAASVAAAVSAANAATSANTASTIVARDANGNFSAGTITAKFVGDGSGLTGAPQGTVAAADVTMGTFGAGVLLPANQLSGTLPNATLSGTYSEALTLDNVANSFKGTLIGNADTATTAATATTALSATTAATATTAGSAANFTGSLAGDVTGTQGATTVANVGGQTAASVAAGVSAANAATSASTASTIVARDANGNFSAGTITAKFVGDGSGLTGAPQGSVAAADVTSGTFGAGVLLPAGQLSGTLPSATLSGTYSEALTLDNAANSFRGTLIGHADTATTAATATTATTAGSAANFTGSLAGDVTGTQGATVVAQVGGKSASAVAASINATAAATSLNTPSTIVARDANGDLAAGTITATTYKGNGSQLTGITVGSVAADHVTAGTFAASIILPASQLSGTVSDAGVADNLTISAGVINNTPVGQTTPAAGSFTTLSASGNVNLGDATADIVTIAAGQVNLVTPGSQLNFGATSANLFLSSAGRLKTDGSLEVATDLLVTGNITGSGPGAGTLHFDSSGPSGSKASLNADTLELNSMSASGKISVNKPISGAAAKAGTATSGATPSVANLTALFLNYSSATSITDLAGGVEGQIVILIGNGTGPANTPIVRDNDSPGHGNFRLSKDTDWSADMDDTLTLVFVNGIWFETARSTN